MPGDHVAIISCLLTNLAPLNIDESSVFWSFRKDVEKLSKIISSIHAVLDDAERKIKLGGDKDMEDWLRKFKDVAYEVRDIMNKCVFEDLRLQVKRLNASSSSTRIQVIDYFSHSLSNTWMRHKIGHKIFSKRNNLHLCETTRYSKSTSFRKTISRSSEKVYGRDKEKEKIIDILVHTSPDGIEKLSVLPIHGLGGLGKTTLAQLIFHDEKITKCFDVKYWVCLSEEFDIKLVIKAILGTTNENSLEILQNQIQDKLKGKKYLIVLDDVWNENVPEWNELRSILDCGLNGSFILTTTRKRIVAEIMKTNQRFELLRLSNEDCWQLFEERAFMYGTPKTTNLIDIGKEIAQKCMGVPLVVKTLGSQLSFKSDEKDWCTIRDSEMWKISENQESILPILRLSYYDLPYTLRICFAFCAIFPKDIEIEKEMLIQLWMAHDLISINKNQEGESQGNIIWNELCRRSFFQDEKEELIVHPNTYEVRRTCKMHDLMHDFAQHVMLDECCTLDAKSWGADLKRETRHLTLMVNSLSNTLRVSLKGIRNLQSIILYPHNYEIFSKEFWSDLKEHRSLRVLEVSRNLQSQDLSYLGCLKHLRYLNFSSCRLKTLPNSICGLLNLQTLKLNDCYNLESLPRNMKDLINLQHLYLDGCRNLRYMPGGMGRLKDIKTLSLVVVGKKNRDCQLDELKDLDIKGSLEIRNLERVSDASIERGVSMATKSRINKLELQWEENDDDERKSRDEKIGEALEVSSTSLIKILRMEGYRGVNIPKWMGKLYASLTILHLSALDNVEHVFTLNRDDMNGMVFLLFPFLEALDIWDMKNLRELVSPPIPIPITIVVLPNLCKIHITNCPKLGALPLHLNSLKVVTVEGECTDELLHSISNLSALDHLTLMFMEEKSVLFGGGNKVDDEAHGGPASTFQSLLHLEIRHCSKLSCLFDEGWEKLARGGGGCIRNLNSLSLQSCPELVISLEQWRNLTHSLQNLTIGECPKLVPSKVEEPEDVITLLRSIRDRLGSDNFNVDILNNED